MYARIVHIAFAEIDSRHFYPPSFSKYFYLDKKAPTKVQVLSPVKKKVEVVAEDSLRLNR
jgi:hypothetical protein